MKIPGINKGFKYFKSNGKPKTLIYTGSRKGSSFSGKGGRSLAELNRYWTYYENEGTIFAAVNSIMYNTVMVGYSVICKDPKAEDFLEQLCQRVSLEEALTDAMKDSLVFGDAFLEKRRNGKGEVIDLYPVDPRTMQINYDQYGRTESYQQVIEGREQSTILKPEDIIHFKLFTSPGTPYGISIIKPNVDTIQRKVETDEALFQAIQRHGTSKIVAYVGDPKEDKLPDEEVLEAIQKKLEDISSINDFVVPHVIKLDTIDEKGVQGVEEYYDLFQNELIIGLMCPEEALGQGKGSTEATARVKAVLYERMIKSFQRRLANTVVKHLFNEQLDKAGFNDSETGEAIYSRIKFNSVTEEDEALRAKWWSNIIRGFRGEIPMTGNEFRYHMGLEPREGLDELMINRPRETREVPLNEEPEEEEEEE